MHQCITEGFQDAGIFITELCEFENGDDFIRDFTPGRFDLIVLDIFMGTSSGVDTAEKIRAIDTQTKIIFCTSSNEFASEAFGVNACFYVLKPIDAEKMKHMISRLNLSEFLKNRYILLPDGQKILARSIMYTECMDHVLFLHISNGTTVKTRLQQYRLESMLSSFSQFHSCSKGLLVNFEYVTKKTNSDFLMKDGAILPISRRKAKETTAAFENYLFEQLDTFAKG